MKSFKTVLGIAALSVALTALAEPALALGRCGPNRHRNHWGECVWGGQNQAWCVRHTGRFARRAPDGSMWCPH